MTMQCYIGTKTLMAKPMTLGEYNALRGWDMPEGEDPQAPGYLVEYQDGGKANHPDHAGYISWSPADVFTNTYYRTEGLTYGQALEMAKQGKRITRRGWNGAGQFVYLQRGDDTAKAFGYGFGEYLNEPAFNDCLILRNAQNRLVMGWTASTGDTLAIDWSVIE